MARLLICVLVALSLVASSGCGRNKELPPQDHPSSIAATATRQQFGEFSFEVPGGWSQVSPDRSTTKAHDPTWWNELDEFEGNDQGRCWFARIPTVQEMAKGFAQSVGGQVLPNAVDVDGVSGARSHRRAPVCPSRAKSLSSTRMVRHIS